MLSFGGEKSTNLSYIVPRDPSIRCWDDRVKLSGPRTKTIMDELEEEVSDDKLKVYLRIKPSKGLNTSYTIVNNTTLETEAPRESVSYKNVSNGIGKLVHKFTFTSILNQTSSQTTIFEKCVLTNLKKFLHGENFLLMAYGTTSAGKTFTMQGSIEHPGIIPRAMGFVFNCLREKIEASNRYQPYRSNEFCLLNDDSMRKELIYKNYILNLDLNKYQKHPEMSYMNYKQEATMATASSSGFSDGYENTTFREMEDRLSYTETYEVSNDRYCVWISMVEIYNEQVYDLLEIPDEKGGRTKLCYGEDETGNVYIKNLKYINVSSGHEAYQVLQYGRANLHLAPTALNHSSSRSHCICTITMARFLDEENAIISRFSFCDLAGMERAKKTLNAGDRLAESKSINTSLLILVKCLTIIKENQSNRDKKMIPFRESKLTRLFKDAMTGKEKLSMIVNVTTEPNLFDETLNVLKFSAIAQQIVPKNIFAKPRRVKPAGRSRFSRLVVKARESSKVIDWDTSTVIDEESRIHSNQGYKDLLDLVDRLKAELAEEKEKNETIEIEIRKELTSEFSDMIKKQRERENDRLESEKTRLQDYFERKEKRLLEKLERQNKKRKLEDAEMIDVEREENLREIQKQCDYLTAENNSLRDQLDLLNEENKNLIANVTHIKFELTEKNRLIEQLERKTKASDAGTDELVKELQTQLEAASAKNTEFKDLLNDAANEHKELMENNQFLRDENDTFEKDLASKCEMVEDLKTEVAELQKLIAQKTETVEELESAEFAMKEELKAAQDKIEEINKLKEDEINERNAEIDTLQKEIKRLNMQILNSLNGEKSASDELKLANKKIKELELGNEKLKSVEEKIKELELGKEELSKQMESLRKEVEDFAKTKKELEEKLEKQSQNLDFDKRKYESEINCLQKKLEALEFQNNIIAKMKDDAEKSAEDAREEFELLKNEIDNKDKELKSFVENRQQMFSNYEKEISKLKEENDRMRKDITYQNEVLMKNITPLKSNQSEIQKLKESLKKKDEEIFKLKSAVKSPPKVAEVFQVPKIEILPEPKIEILPAPTIEITSAPDSDLIESSSSRENSPFKDIHKKRNKNKKPKENNRENTPDRLAKQIEQMSLTLATSTAKKSRRKVDQLEESIHPCTVKGNGRKGRKGKAEKEAKKEEEIKKQEPTPLKKDTRCNKKLFTENDFDNMENLDSSFVEPEIPRLRPRK